MSKKISFLILILLTIGIIYRFLLTLGGNFLFNMDNGRDMVDVREMVVLKKLRLIGPTSAIEGFYNGPAWYYFLAIPFILTSGDPYGSIIMEILLWAVGGFFLLKLTSRFGVWAMLISGCLWIASNYIVLASVYAFNPNPVTFLTPLLIFLIERYIITGKLKFAVLMWFLAGLFFNFEMNFGIFVPPIIIFSILFSKKLSFLKNKNFWTGLLIFIITLVPQVLFDLKHQFIMSKSIMRFLSESGGKTNLNPALRVNGIFQSFYKTLSATFFNNKFLTQFFLVIFLIYIFKLLRNRYLEDVLILICLTFVFIPFIGYILLPVQVNPWHLGGIMVALIILLSVFLIRIFNFGFIGKLTSFIISGLIIFYAAYNISHYFTYDRVTPNLDPSSYKNEILAIDYVYKYANGENFKVYTYLPSVIDYPYQYLFWWYGKKKYGYIPGEYAYSPNKPQYISNKDKFEGRKDNFSGLVFLIKEPDRIGLRGAWQDDFKNMEFISKEMVGPLEIEIRKEIKKS